MTEYIDKTEAMRRFKPFGREIPIDEAYQLAEAWAIGTLRG